MVKFGLPGWTHHLTGHLWATPHQPPDSRFYCITSYVPYTIIYSGYEYTCIYIYNYMILYVYPHESQNFGVWSGFMCFYPPIFFHQKRPHFGPISARFFTRQLEFLLHQLSRSAGDGDSDGEDIHWTWRNDWEPFHRKNGGVLRCRLNHEDVIHGYYMINIWIIWDIYIYIHHYLGKFHHDLTSWPHWNDDQ